MIPYDWIRQASERINTYIHKTPLTFDEQYQLYIKWENHQVTGSFKARGAFNKILSLQDWEVERSLVTASAGNHGQGVALAARVKGARVIVFASEHAQPNKLQAMRDLDAEIHLVQGGYGEAEAAAISYAEATGAIWVSPYNDGLVIAGQGTIALEILPELEKPAAVTWIVPAGGGGLVSGIGCGLQNIKPYPRLVAVQSEASPFLYNIYHHGTQKEVIERPSVADGLAGPVEEGSVTIPIVRNYVTSFILVSESEIRAAIKYAWDRYSEKIEGSGAAALAIVLFHRVTERPALAIISGGNIEPDEHMKIITETKPFTDIK